MKDVDIAEKASEIACLREELQRERVQHDEVIRNLQKTKSGPGGDAGGVSTAGGATRIDLGSLYD